MASSIEAVLYWASLTVSSLAPLVSSSRVWFPSLRRSFAGQFLKVLRSFTVIYQDRSNSVSEGHTSFRTSNGLIGPSPQPMKERRDDTRRANREDEESNQSGHQGDGRPVWIDWRGRGSGSGRIEGVDADGPSSCHPGSSGPGSRDRRSIMATRTDWLNAPPMALRFGSSDVAQSGNSIKSVGPSLSRPCDGSPASEGGSYEEHYASLCAGVECTIKKNRTTLDRWQYPFIAALFQQEDWSYAGGDAAACGRSAACHHGIEDGWIVLHQSFSITCQNK